MRLMVFKYSNKKGRQKNKGNCLDLKKSLFYLKKEPSYKTTYITYRKIFKNILNKKNSPSRYVAIKTRI